MEYLFIVKGEWNSPPQCSSCFLGNLRWIPHRLSEGLFCQELPFPLLPGGAPGSVKCQVTHSHFCGSPTSQVSLASAERQKDPETIRFSQRASASDSYPTVCYQCYLEISEKVQWFRKKHSCSFQESPFQRKWNSGQRLYVQNKMYIHVDGEIYI